MTHQDGAPAPEKKAPAGERGAKTIQYDHHTPTVPTPQPTDHPLAIAMALIDQAARLVESQGLRLDAAIRRADSPARREVDNE